MTAAFVRNLPAVSVPEVVVLEVGRRPMSNFNYIIFDRDSRDAVIVDPAWEMDTLLDALDERKLRLRAVLVTHSHRDHLNLAEPIAAFYRCPIRMSAQEVAHAGFRSDRLRCIDEPLLRIGTLEVEAMLTPGHTPGCVCFRIGDNLFTGDVLFAEGCGMCPTVEAAEQMFDSLAHIRRSIAGSTRVFPGHSYGKPPGQQFSALLSENIYLQFADAPSFVAFRMRPGQSWMRALRRTAAG